MIESIPEMIEDFIRTMEPLDIKIELELRDFDDKLKYICCRSMKQGFRLFDEKMRVVGRKRLKSLDFQDWRFGVSYTISVTYWPNKEHCDLIDSFAYHSMKLENAIGDLKIVKQWVEKYPEISFFETRRKNETETECDKHGPLIAIYEKDTAQDAIEAWNR